MLKLLLLSAIGMILEILNWFFGECSRRALARTKWKGPEKLI
mgnify:CR=1 FL=1